jgi:hypothetical protein
MELKFRKWAVACVVVAAAGCGGAGFASGPHDDGGGGGDMGFGFPPASDMMPSPATSHVAYRLSSDGHIYRVAAQAGAVPEDVSKGLTSAGSDTAVGISRDGRWLGLLTTRFGCGSWACLALVATSPRGATATTGTLVMIGGQPVHSEGRPAVARGAGFVVYSAAGGPHTRDLWIARASAGAQPGDGSYEAAMPLTTGSNFAMNDLPALTPDEQTVVFDCQQPSTAQSVNLCMVGVDGKGFRPIIGPNEVAGHTATEVHSGDVLPDGTLVFEGDWLSEQIWRRDTAGTLARPAPSYTNDNSPCALPDGRIASLWLERPGNPMGFHELKVMTLDGTGTMVVTGLDIADIGIGCGE